MSPETRFERALTAQDRRWLGAMGCTPRTPAPEPVVSMSKYLDAKASEDAATKVAHSLGKAYEHLEAECAEAHRAAKRSRSEARDWRHRAIALLALAIVLAVALGVAVYG
jgi:hypothetical protein